MSRIHSLFVTTAAAVLSFGGTSPLAAQAMSVASAASKPASKPAVARIYGTAVKVGDGNARSYVLFDETTGAPREIGVALSERALDSLPAGGSGHHGAGAMTHEFILALPEGNKTPFQFVEMNWNPMGHEPDGVYQDVPHFDFHFYTVSKAERDAIVPTDPDFAKKANNVPAKEYVPAFNVPLAPPGATPAQVAVPMMGVHWLDIRSPELQKLFGKPEAYKPFTATFIHGSWDGRFHFWEPMITRAHILEKKTTNDPAVRDQVMPLPLPAKYQTPGYYPAAYRITWDVEAREYRIALTDLTSRQ
jgi:hypothetical protein